MLQLLYPTTNQIKFDKAKQALDQTKVKLKRVHFDFEEIQSRSGKKIALHKARQAYEFFQQPLVVSDDVWNVPALNGFPGPYMKEVNDWLTPQDWFNLIRNKSDRRIKLISNVAYKDEKREKVFAHQSHRLFIPDSKEISNQEDLLDIIALKGSDVVISQLLKQKKYVEKSNDEFWRRIASWYQDLPF